MAETPGARRVGLGGSIIPPGRGVNPKSLPPNLDDRMIRTSVDITSIIGRGPRSRDGRPVSDQETPKNLPRTPLCCAHQGVETMLGRERGRERAVAPLSEESDLVAPRSRRSEGMGEAVDRVGRGRPTPVSRQPEGDREEERGRLVRPATDPGGQQGESPRFQAARLPVQGVDQVDRQAVAVPPCRRGSSRRGVRATDSRRRRTFRGAVRDRVVTEADDRPDQGSSPVISGRIARPSGSTGPLGSPIVTSPDRSRS